MVYLLKMVIFHGYVSHNQMVYGSYGGFPKYLKSNQTPSHPSHDHPGRGRAARLAASAGGLGQVSMGKTVRKTFGTPT